MSKMDPQYSPLLQGDSSDEEAEERGIPATESLRGDDEEKSAGLPFPKPYKPHRPEPTARPRPLYIFLAVVGTILVGLLIAIIAGAIRNTTEKKPAPHPQTHSSSNGTVSTQTSHHAPASHTHFSQRITTHKPEVLTQRPEPTTKGSTHTTAKTIKPTADWQVVLNNTGAEASIRTPDIDGDGLPDVLFGVAHGVDLATANTLDEVNGLKKYCEEKHVPYPCIGFLIALRGYDGKELWRVSTRSEVMFMMCDLDLNGDSAKDCVVTGRQSTAQAVDLRTGKTLWYADGSEYPKFFVQTWNVYQATPLPDVDGDGVPDVVVAHGGDPNIDAEIHDRVAGRLIVLSGATGRPLGNYLEMPNSRETYMSPVMYTDTDGSQYLLFGSGGETVSGDLMAITLPDLLEATKQKIKVNLPGRYKWKDIHPHDRILVLYQGKQKGVMVPPVMVDVDNDGVMDVVVSVFEGYIVLLDGNTLFPKWETPFPNMESYSSPAPGYYDDDEYLDFMVHWSTGAWPHYNESKVFILSGKTGSILWEDSRPLYVMSSDLVLTSQEDHKDYFMVKMRGQPTGVGSVMRSEVHGVGVQRNISRRDVPTYDDNDDDDDDNDMSSSCEYMLSEYKKNHVTCEQNLFEFGEQVYLMSRDNGSNLTLIHQVLAEKFNYDVTPSSAGLNCIPINEKTGKGRMCGTLVPESRSTDAVTDVDDDGVLDLVSVGILEGRLRDSRYDYVAMQYTTIISRTNINKVLQKSSAHKGHTAKTMFSPLKSQPWLQYMGSDGSSVYTRH